MGVYDVGVRPDERRGQSERQRVSRMAAHVPEGPQNADLEAASLPEAGRVRTERE